MIDTRALYTDQRFTSYLRKLARKAAIKADDFEDFKHDIFFEVLHNEAETIEDAERVARKIQQQYWRERENERNERGDVTHFSYDDMRMPLDSYFSLPPERRMSEALREGVTAGGWGDSGLWEDGF